MGKTATLLTEPEMDIPSLFCGVGDGNLRREPEESTSETTKIARQNQGLRPLDYPRENTAELLSALLASPTLDPPKAPVQSSKKRPAAAIGDASPPKPPKACLPKSFRRANGEVDNGAISRANREAFAANQALAPAVLPPRRQPSTAVQPTTTARQRKGTPRYSKPAHKPNGTEPQQAGYRPAWDVLDQSDLRAKMRPSPAMPGSAEIEQTKAPTIQNPFIVLRGDQRKSNRNSLSILALTDAARRDPKDVMSLRRSKTTREAGMRGGMKHKGVLKKMTDALTDRLHLKNRATDSEAGDTDEGCGDSYGYETNQFLRDVDANIPTRKRQLPSRLTEIYERENVDETGDQVSDGGSDTMSDVQYSPIKEASEDPFADPHSSKATGEFVNRCKATTPSKTGRPSVPITPSASHTEMGDLFRNSFGSILPFTPEAASTPRPAIKRAGDYGDCDNMSPGSPTPNLEVDESRSENATSNSTGHDLLACGFAYQPVLDVPNRKKHPSPNKLDLELLESRILARLCPTLAQATEKAKKHPSPLKVDIQELGQQFRQTYPDLLGGNTPDQSMTSSDMTMKRKKNIETSPLSKDETDTDELLLSFVSSTPEKKRMTTSRHRKASSVSCSNSKEALLSKKDKRKTVAMPPCLDTPSSPDGSASRQA